VVEQVANYPAVLFRYQTLKSRAQTKPISQVSLSGQLEVGLVAENAEVIGKLFRQAANRRRIGRQG
jgi:hypothetical protein